MTALSYAIPSPDAPSTVYNRVPRVTVILAFWLAYILTRPMGASFGDLLSQPVADDGLGCATVVTRFMFLGAIAALILYITFSRDGIEVAVATVRSGDEVW